MESDSASCWSSNFEIGSDQRLKKVSSSKCVNGLTWKLFPSSLVHLFLQNGFYNSQKLFAITSRWKKFTISTTYLLTYLQKYIPTYKSTYLPTKAQTYLQKHKPTYKSTNLPTYLQKYLPTYLQNYIPIYKNNYQPTKYLPIGTYYMVLHLFLGTNIFYYINFLDTIQTRYLLSTMQPCYQNAEIAHSQLC